MSRWKNIKATVAGLGTGICLMSLITLDTSELWVNLLKIASGGVSLAGWTSYIVQEIDDRRTYWLLYQSDNKRMKILSDNKDIESTLKSTIEDNLRHNLEEETELLNGDWTTHSSIDELKQMLESISNSETLMNEKLECILRQTQTSNGKP